MEGKVCPKYGSLLCSLRAPDPTAGGGVNDSSTWYFDESGVREQLRLDLAAVAAYGMASYIGVSAAELNSQTVLGPLSTNGRLFNNGNVDLPRHRFNRSSRHSMDDEEVGEEAAAAASAAASAAAKHRHSGPRSFAQLWLENYRYLQRAKLPPFGYTLFSLSTAPTNLPSPPSSTVHGVNGLSQMTNQSASTGSPNASTVSTFPSPNPSGSGPSPSSHHVPGRQVAMVFAKTYELLAARDTNGPRLLSIITEELLNSANLVDLKGRRNYRDGSPPDRGNWDSSVGDLDEDPDELDDQDASNRPQSTTTSAYQPPPSWAIPLWEEIARLWACLLLSPSIPSSTRDSWRERLTSWSMSPQAPRDDIYFNPPPTNPMAAENLTSEAVSTPPLIRPPSRTTVDPEPTSVFQLALDVSALPVEVAEEFPAIPRNALADLARTLPANVRQCTCPYCGVSPVIERAWGLNENFVASCLRASALQLTGYGEAATLLAVALANALLGCLEEVGRRGAAAGCISLGSCSPSPTPPPLPPPTQSFARSNSGSSNKSGTLSSSLIVNTSCGGGGGPTRGGFRSPPPPPPQHSSPYHQRHYQHQHPYFFYSSPPSPSGPRTYPYHHQQARYRCSPWQRTPPRHDQQYLLCASEASVDCPFHECGWIGMPGRPIIGLVECLLEAAANKIQDPGRGGLSVNDYLHLALKVGIVALCQQRSLPLSTGAFLASQSQEVRLILLLNTIPRNATTAQIITQLVYQLMGPPPIPPLLGGPQEAWWWSALGPVVHPDTYPVHVVAELLFGHLLAGETAGINTGDLAYLVAARSMRFPVLEPVSDRLPLAIAYTTSASQRHGDNSTRSASYVSMNSTSSPLRSLPLPSTFVTAALSGGGSTPLGASLPPARILIPPPPPPPTYYRSAQETLRHHAHNLYRRHALDSQDSTPTAYRRDLGVMEERQVRLAIGLILASRSAVFRMDHFMRICDRHIHTAMSLMSVSREVLAEAIGHRLHSSTTAFTLDEPNFLANSVASSASSLGFANLLPVNFVTSPLPTTSLQERHALVCAAFHLALSVTVRTVWPRAQWRRRETLGWAVSTGLLAGPLALLHLAQAWTTYACPREAVIWLAPTLLACVACVSPTGRAARGEGMLLLPRVYSFLPFTPGAVEQIKAAVRQMTIQAKATV
ncbi:unnamed protein product [Mesocestoides corti]|uniref:Uncharacterized protein n=1 Tax=Mesocestoides corti TaxID=53468 RepID=A0A158QU21_MESCO|nr:unnamed protein product [Mesocestoides corti]